MEYDLFPLLIKERCFGYVRKTELIDYGTPDGYEKARAYFAKCTIFRKGKKRKLFGRLKKFF